MSLSLCFIFIIATALSQSDKDPASFCGCEMHRDYHAYEQPYDPPGGTCRYYCRSTTLSYYSKYMNKEIRVASVYDKAGTIELTLCDGNTTDLSKPVILYLTSYDPIHWMIDSDEDYILNNIIIDEIYVEYLREDKGKSTVTLNNTLFIHSNPSISINGGEWNGYGDDEDSNKILHFVKKRWDSELYSFCGGYSGSVELCVGEYDIVGNDYPSDNAYEECKIPMSTFGKSMLRVLATFAFWCIICGVPACVSSRRKKRKQRKAEEEKRQRQQLEKEKRERERERYRKEQVELERVRKKNEDVYVGDEQKEDKRFDTKMHTKYNGNESDDKLPKYEDFDDKILREIGNNNNNNDVISNQPTLSYSAMSCVICLDVLLEHEATKLICGHKFHTHCIEEYNETNENCPLCRKKIQY